MRVAFIHHLPLELYPPSTNAITFFGGQPKIDVLVITSKNDKGRADFVCDTARIVRFPMSWRSKSSLQRLCLTVRWHWNAAKLLAEFQPDAIIYFEPHSAFTAFLYMRLHSRSVRLFVHHHEYYESRDYSAKGNRITQFNHFLETRFLYRRAEWISQTNQSRLELFFQDHPFIDPLKLKVMGNYPPASWRERLKIDGCRLSEPAERAELTRQGRREITMIKDGYQVPPQVEVGTKALRLVYVGSVSLHDTFIGPLVEWIRDRDDDAVTLDVYAYNADEKTKTFLREAEGGRAEAGGRSDKSVGRIRYFEEGVDYYDLPDVLSNYDVGVILYRCNTTNYKFNASNKLFEYLACGLDVWYPPQMVGVRPYAQDNAFPRVMEINFERLDTYDLHKISRIDDLPMAKSSPSCEEEYEKLLDAIVKEAW